MLIYIQLVFTAMCFYHLFNYCCPRPLLSVWQPTVCVLCTEEIGNSLRIFEFSPGDEESNLIIPLASRNTRLSFSSSSRAVDRRTPKAPVTRRRANAAHVSGRWRYGCKWAALFLALARDSIVACVSGFSFTNGWPMFIAWAATMEAISYKIFT